MTNIHDILKKHWGYTTFRPLQQDIIQAVLQGKDTLALMPTGAGKSLCFQIPAIAQQGLCLVISPLIALMQDQVHKLKKKGIHATCIFSGMSQQNIEQTLNNCVHGKTKLLYLSPERLQTTLFLTYLKNMHINLLVIDEAHCISTWGEDFRPSYKNIGTIKKLLPNTTTLALTATATDQVKQDIQQQLNLKQPQIFRQSFIRHNLAYIVKQTHNLNSQLIHILQRTPGTAIIYTNTRASTKTIAQHLQQHNIQATHYHAGLPPQTRTAHQKTWITNNVRVIVATNAFGMGIDKPDVRTVIHISPPASIEAYYQESGRAGRDGHKAYAILLYNNNTLDKLKNNLKTAHPTLQTIKKIYQCLANYYQIAIGSHHMTTHPIDLQHFTLTYQLNPTTVLQAIKQLQQEGLIHYNDHFFKPAQLHIIAPPKALYAYQQTQPQHNKIIQTLIYTYGDKLFTRNHPISLKTLAPPIDTTPKILHQELQQLDTLGILHYTPQQNHANITFTTPRYDQASLPLSTQRLEQRQQQAHTKLQAMLHYIHHKHRCRTQILVEYFGQVSYTPCGLCDICITKNTQPITIQQATNQYRPHILTHIKQNKRSVHHIIQAINPQKANLITKVIQTMINQGELAYDKTLRLILTQ